MLKNQKYSDAVFFSINGLANEDKMTAKRYKSLCKRSGGIFRTVGLVQFVTFIEAKGKKEKHYAWLSEHLRTEMDKVGALKSKGTEDYLANIRRLNLPEYMQASRNMLTLLQWHKRIGEILIEGTADDTEGE
ncbi:CRISPR type III-B/RAMP module-associated protein Cmr5 [Desulfobotulus alkaliphilus]|uniref:CRISPR type III-B/RAMP module-associated protein Cmr5 n=1 Tax=Desulfobotulus alkaliphilus TaxID=622671 RepID=A0A562R1F5_9BACT|nr:type III-B CRISPR module-associated protein Cmr5 [Desulfobotulus alkaliphilus]TWI62867.1 CRISPR type III-B/RAMP module-associated protein Cmr5 [Desulfobotulus alkaliphilus]